MTAPQAVGRKPVLAGFLVPILLILAFAETAVRAVDDLAHAMAAGTPRLEAPTRIATSRRLLETLRHAALRLAVDPDPDTIAATRMAHVALIAAGALDTPSTNPPPWTDISTRLQALGQAVVTGTGGAEAAHALAAFQRDTMEPALSALQTDLAALEEAARARANSLPREIAATATATGRILLSLAGAVLLATLLAAILTALRPRSRVTDPQPDRLGGLLRAVEQDVDALAWAETVEQLVSETHATTRRIGQSSGLIANATEAAGAASRIVHDITGEARRIGDLVSLIRAIARQTAVATPDALSAEVRVLAGETRQAADAIAGQIAGVHAIAQGSASAIHDLALAIAEVNRVATGIAVAVERIGQDTTHSAAALPRAHASGLHDALARQAAALTAEVDHLVKTARQYPIRVA